MFVRKPACMFLLGYITVYFESLQNYYMQRSLAKSFPGSDCQLITMSRYLPVTCSASLFLNYKWLGS